MAFRAARNAQRSSGSTRAAQQARAMSIRRAMRNNGRATEPCARWPAETIRTWGVIGTDDAGARVPCALKDARCSENTPGLIIAAYEQLKTDPQANARRHGGDRRGTRMATPWPWRIRAH